MSVSSKLLVQRLRLRKLRGETEKGVGGSGKFKSADIVDKICEADVTLKKRRDHVYNARSGVRKNLMFIMGGKDPLRAHVLSMGIKYDERHVQNEMMKQARDGVVIFFVLWFYPFLKNR